MGYLEGHLGHFPSGLLNNAILFLFCSIGKSYQRHGSKGKVTIHIKTPQRLRNLESQTLHLELFHRIGIADARRNSCIRSPIVNIPPPRLDSLTDWTRSCQEAFIR